MVIKGKPFVFRYEVKSTTTGALVADPGTHTIIVNCLNSSGVYVSTTVIADQTPESSSRPKTTKPIYISPANSGVYLYKLDGTYTNCSHLLVNIFSSTNNTVIPVFEYRPFDLDALAAKVWEVGEDSGFASDSGGESSLSTETVSDIISGVWANSSRTLTSVTGLDIAKESTLTGVVGSNTCSGSALGINDSEGETSITLQVSKDSNGQIISIS